MAPLSLATAHRSTRHQAFRRALDHSGCLITSYTRAGLRQDAAATFSSRPYTIISSPAAAMTAHAVRESAGWDAVMQQKDIGQNCQCGVIDNMANVTPTPHPAAASTAERNEWEAVLSATEGPQQAVTHDDKAQRVYAVVECGSHSTRLLISTGTTDVERLTLDTHLGVSSTHTWQQQQQHNHPPPIQQAHHQPTTLQPHTAAATLDALKHYRSVLDQYSNIASIAAVATAAVREAAVDENNDGAFMTAASGVIGCSLQVLSGSSEACLSFIGATATLAIPGYPCCCLVFDMGGKSTEIAVGIAGQSPKAVCSIPLGCLNIRLDTTTLQPTAAAAAPAVGHQQCDPLLDTQRLTHSAQQILSAHAGLLNDVQQAYLTVHKQQQQQQQATAGDSCDNSQQTPAAAAAAGVAVLGTGGTITSISALLLQLPAYRRDAVHMTTLSQEDIKQFISKLQQPDYIVELMRKFPWLTKLRASSLLPGCAGILAVMQHLDVQQVLVSDSDLLDGVVQALVAREGGTTGWVDVSDAL